MRHQLEFAVTVIPRLVKTLSMTLIPLTDAFGLWLAAFGVKRLRVERRLANTPRLPKIKIHIQHEKWELVIVVTLSGQTPCGRGNATFGTFVRFYPKTSISSTLQSGSTILDVSPFSCCYWRRSL